MKNLLYIFIIFIFFTSSVFSQSSKINSILSEKLNKISSNEKIPVYIIFKEHLQLKDFDDISYDTPKDERRRIVIDRLQKYSSTSQAEVRRFLNSKISSGNADQYDVLWMANILTLKADKSVIAELVNSKNNIESICYDAVDSKAPLNDVPLSVPFINSTHSSYVDSPNSIDPGIILIKADQCWALGNTGQGVLLADVEDGFWWKHPDLVHGIWQNLGEDANHNGRTIDIQSGTGSTFDPGDLNGIDDDGNGKIDDLIGWDYDANNGNITTAALGTASLGSILGDGTGGTNTGVAPGSKSILLRNNIVAETYEWYAFQYAVQMGADIISSDVSFHWFDFTKPNYSAMRNITDMSLAAGVIQVHSAGNGGSFGSEYVPMNIETPGNCPPPWLHPNQLKRGGVSAVIGVGNVDAGTDIISTSSSYGPTTWGNWNLFGLYPHNVNGNHYDYSYSVRPPVEIPDSMGLIKPDVSAPGDGSISTNVSSGSGYAAYGGTEAASSHTAGCIALMLSTNPEMLPADIDKVLELTAVEKGAPGKDNRYGSGRIDALAATTSPKFLVEGITTHSNMLISHNLATSDTAKELVGLKISAPLNPQVGSLKKLTLGITTTALPSDIISFDLWWDKDRNGIINAGDKKLKSVPYSVGTITFDTLKWKFLDTSRTLIVTARTTGSASSLKTVDFSLNDTSQVVAYYTTTPLQTNFPILNVTGISNNNGFVPTYSLSQNYPNPFNPSTIIKYEVAKNSFVTIKIYDMIGREVTTLINSFKTAGNYQVEFDTRDNNLSSGIYYYKMSVRDQNFTDIKKMILIK